jgi:hypothetical protein
MDYWKCKEIKVERNKEEKKETKGINETWKEIKAVVVDKKSV